MMFASPRPPIILVAFGSTVSSARRVYERLREEATRRYAGHEIHWAFTSRRVREHLHGQGHDARSPQEVLDALAQGGVRRAVLQSFHVVPGEEHAGLRALHPRGLTLARGQPLLASPHDLEQVAGILAASLRPGRLNVVVCHGNNRHPEYNRPHLELAAVLARRHAEVVVASLEGEPGAAPLLRARDRAAGAVHFIPLLLVAGRHVRHDLLGDQPDSWRNLLAAQAWSVADPLGLNDRIVDLYFAHLDEALTRLLISDAAETTDRGR